MVPPASPLSVRGAPGVAVPRGCPLAIFTAVNRRVGSDLAAPHATHATPCLHPPWQAETPSSGAYQEGTLYSQTGAPADISGEKRPIWRSRACTSPPPPGVGVRLLPMMLSLHFTE